MNGNRVLGYLFVEKQGDQFLGYFDLFYLIRQAVEQI